ncbi:MAG: SIMPL domain-containing protein, partial [Nanoarchaeota archaeon]
ENTITFSGYGEVFATPDIANISFTIRKEAKTVKIAQEGVALIEKNVLAMLKTNKVEDKDIKTINASFNPKYEYRYDKQIIPCTQYDCPPTPGKSVIIGYEAYENISLKIRNTDDTGKIIQELGTIGVTELSGPNFSVDDEDGLKALARKKAITDAKEKAKSLARDLGVRLGKITSFSESGNYPVPIYSKGMMLDSAESSSAPAVIPKGENTISSNVSITYELK